MDDFVVLNDPNSKNAESNNSDIPNDSNSEGINSKDPKCRQHKEDEEYIRKNAVKNLPPPLACDDFKDIVRECYKKHRSETIKCSKEVEAFETCVKLQFAFLLKSQQFKSKVRK